MIFKERLRRIHAVLISITILLDCLYLLIGAIWILSEISNLTLTAIKVAIYIAIRLHISSRWDEARK